MDCVFDTGSINLTNNVLTWRIYKFFSLPLKVGCEIRSQQFEYRDSRYCLYIWPRGRKGNGTEEWFGICLHKDGAPGIGDTVQFSIATTMGNVIKCTVECSENNLFRQERFVQWSDFLTLSHRIAPNGNLTIVCKLFIENRKGSFRNGHYNSRGISYPTDDPPVKFQSGDYHSGNPLPFISSFKVNSPDPAISSSNCGPPSTINSFYSSSTFDNSFECIPESVETRNSDFKMPFDASGCKTENALRKTYLHGLDEVSSNDKPEASAKSGRGTPQKKTSKSAGSTMKSSSIKKSSLVNVKSSTNGLEEVSNSSPESIQSEEPCTSSCHCQKGLKALSENLKSLYLEGKFFDLTIIMDGTEFKVLRALLMNRSPVFEKLLSKDTDGSTTNIITIDPFDACDSTIFNEFLLYLYSGEIEDRSERHIYGLYCAARKFEIEVLKEECMEFLQASLSIDTIVHVFKSADTDSNDSELLGAAVIFLAKNLKAIMKSDEWKQFSREDSDRALEYNLKALEIGYKKTIE